MIAEITLPGPDSGDEPPSQPQQVRTSYSYTAHLSTSGERKQHDPQQLANDNDTPTHPNPTAAPLQPRCGLGDQAADAPAAGRQQERGQARR